MAKSSDRDQEFALKQRVTVEVETYSNGQITKWNADDQLSEEDRKRIVDRLARSR